MSRDINQEKLEESKRHQFDAYCKKILRNEARDIYDERKRRQKREVLFSEMQPYELDALYTMPRYRNSSAARYRAVLLFLYRGIVL